MWVELKDNFLDHQTNGEFLWLFLGEIQAKKIFFLVFVNSAFQIYMPWVFCGFCWLGFFCPFLRQLSVLLVPWCHFPWLRREIQQPRWELQNQYLPLNTWLPVTGERSALVQGQECQHSFEVPRLISFQSVTSQGLLGVGDNTEPKCLSWFLAPCGIDCMETRSLIAEPQASFFNCSELILWTLRAAGNVGKWCL